jgi:hypothetical protein
VNRGITKAVGVFFACLVYHALRLLRHDSKKESEHSISTHRRVKLSCIIPRLYGGRRQMSSLCGAAFTVV